MKKKALVSDELWEAIAPLIPPEPKGGRRSATARLALSGILFVLRTDIGWQELPAEMECGSGSICWRRLRDW